MRFNDQSKGSGMGFDGDRNFGIAIARAFEVLRCYSPTRPLLGISEIARLTGLPKATVSRLTYTLEQLGYLYRLMPTGKYRLGWGVLSLGYPLLISMPMRQIARPIMYALAKEVRCNVNMGTLDHLRVVYIETVRFNEAHLVRPDVGVSHPILSSSIGHVILASLKGTDKQSIVNRLRLASPAEWNSAQPALIACERDLQDIGFCVSVSPVAINYTTIAASMRVPMYESPIAFNCAMPTARLRKGEAELEIGPKLLSAIRTVEQQLGSRD